MLPSGRKSDIILFSARGPPADDDGAAVLADFSKASSYYGAKNDTVDAFAVRCGGPKAVVSSPNRVSDVTRTRLTA